MAFAFDQGFPRSAIPEGLGLVVRRERLSRRWSQARLGLMAGVHRRTIMRLEQGLHAPTSHLVCALQEAFGTGALVSGWPEMPVPSSPCYGPRVRLARRAMGITAAVAAAAAGVSPATWSRFERGGSIEAVVGQFDSPNEGIRSDTLARLLGFADAACLERFCMEGTAALINAG